MQKKLYLIILSALLYPVPFCFSEYLTWLAFFFLVPLFYAAVRYGVKFKDGFLWGLITYSIHELGIFYSLIQMAKISQTGISYILYLVLLFIFAIVYQALVSGLWFFASNKIIKFIKIRQTIPILAIWVITTGLYFYFIDNYLLWIFGNTEGYFLVHPLLPLAHFPKLLGLLPILGKTILTLLLIFSSALMTLLLFTENKKLKILIFVAILMPWLVGIRLSKNSFKPTWLDQVAHIPESFYNQEQVAKTITEVTDKLKEIITKYPQVTTVILPESALYLCNLLEFTNLIEQWSSKNLSREINIILGALRSENNINYNTVYWIYDGKIKQWFDKKHSLLLTERIPSWINFAFVRNSYFSNRPIITASKSERPCFNITPEIVLVPYICSEIFFIDHPDSCVDQKSNATVLSLCNDTWIYSAPHLKKLMQLTNRFRAIQWSTNILYVSYSCTYFYDYSGSVWPIK